MELGVICPYLSNTQSSKGVKNEKLQASMCCTLVGYLALKDRGRYHGISCDILVVIGI